MLGVRVGEGEGFRVVISGVLTKEGIGVPMEGLKVGLAVGTVYANGEPQQKGVGASE